MHSGRCRARETAGVQRRTRTGTSISCRTTVCFFGNMSSGVRCQPLSAPGTYGLLPTCRQGAELEAFAKGCGAGAAAGGGGGRRRRRRRRRQPRQEGREVPRAQGQGGRHEGRAPGRARGRAWARAGAGAGAAARVRGGRGGEAQGARSPAAARICTANKACVCCFAASAVLHAERVGASTVAHPLLMSSGRLEGHLWGTGRCKCGLTLFACDSSET